MKTFTISSKCKLFAWGFRSLIIFFFDNFYWITFIHFWDITITLSPVVTSKIKIWMKFFFFFSNHFQLSLLNRFNIFLVTLLAMNWGRKKRTFYKRKKTMERQHTQKIANDRARGACNGMGAKKSAATETELLARKFIKDS